MEDMSPALKKRLMMLMMSPEFKGMPMEKLIEEGIQLEERLMITLIFKIMIGVDC